MDIDWLETLDYFGVEYVERGPNIAQNNIGVQCPWCGGADSSHHMGISLNGKGWGCWRDSEHRGKSAVKLIAALTHRPWREVEKIIGESITPERTDLDDLADLLLTMGHKPAAEVEAIQIPDSFRRITKKPGDAQFFNYIKNRGFSHPLKVVKRYGLLRDTSNDWYGRLIFPIHKERKIIGWTARAITKSNIRYKAHPPGPAISGSLFGTNWCPGGETLFLVEGPFDAIKLDWILRGTQSNAVASMSTALSKGRLKHLIQTASRYENLCILFDHGAEGQALDTLRNVRHAASASMVCLPTEVDDPGDLPSRGGLRIVKEQMAEYGCAYNL